MALRLSLRRWRHLLGISERADPDDVEGTLKTGTNCCSWNQLFFQGLSLPWPFMFLLPNFPVYFLHPHCACVWVCVCLCVLSRVWVFATPWTVAHQAPLSMGFPRQEYWSGLLFLTPGEVPDPGIKPASPALAGRFFTATAVVPGKPRYGWGHRYWSSAGTKVSEYPSICLCLIHSLS